MSQSLSSRHESNDAGVAQFHPEGHLPFLKVLRTTCGASLRAGWGDNPALVLNAWEIRHGNQ